MANINRRWKKFMCIGCTHGHLMDKGAFAKVLKFKKSWNPHTTVHLGDVIDTAAFRSGARGTKDEAEPIFPDKWAARDTLLAYEPNIITWGNHDWRLWEMADHHNAVLSMAATTLRDDLIGIANKLKARTAPYDIDEGWIKLGDTKVGHGYMFDMNSILSHARVIGKCIIAHVHRTGTESADRHDKARAWCVGYLGEHKKFGYAKKNKSFLRWNHGLAFGEYCDDETAIWLAEAPREGEWRLPL